MKRDPFTLFVALDENNEARGRLYIDDGQSFGYRNGKFLEVEFTFKDNKLQSRVVNPGSYATTEWVERVVILGWRNRPASITVSSKSVGTSKLEFEGTHPLVIRKPRTLITEDWEIILS